jgi:hypothetical protein
MFLEACPEQAEGLNSPKDESAVADMTVPFLK